MVPLIYKSKNIQMNNQNLKWILVSIACICTVACSFKKTTPAGSLDLHSLVQPVPLSAKFANDSSYIWGASLVKSETDGKYHLFYSRWPRSLGMQAWVTHSEIAHAVSDSPFGTYRFSDVALAPRGRLFWDGAVTHNPTVHFFEGKYYLYYMGTTGDPSVADQYWEHRNNQRIGVAEAESPLRTMAKV
jgi:hypothetical protein